MNDVCICGGPKDQRSKRCLGCLNKEKAQRVKFYQTCPMCGGYKTRRAQTCMGCLVRTVPKGEPSGTCSCGRAKMKTSLMCKKCRMAGAAATLVCSSCGGPKRRHAAMCRQCSLNRFAGVKKEDRARLIRVGIPAEHHLAMVAALDGAECAICRAPGNALDHDHISGEFRGILCGSCNKGIGLFKEDAERVALALEYMRNPPGITAYIQKQPEDAATRAAGGDR